MDEFIIGCKEYNRSNISRARDLRKRQTPAEEKMWECVLKHRPGGYKFTRQKPISSFIVDFYCAKLSLAIELDGEIHRKRQDYDNQRDLFLSNQGITILRYGNEEIMKNIDQVYKNLLEIIEENK